MHLLNSAFALAFLVCLIRLARPQTQTPSSNTDKTSFWCQQQRENVKLFEVFPGLGWDNLRNEEASPVVKYTFNQCKLTDDGQYLIPDNVFTVPLKRSYIERNAQMFESWQNTSSLTSRSINVNAGLSFYGASISGSYSNEMMSSKARQIGNEAVTVRVKMQFNRYMAKLRPHSPPSDEFRTSVVNLASRVELNQSELAIYEAQLLVRDFGTHVLTGVTAGAALVKDDYLSRDYVASQSNSVTAILASASASYLSIFKADSSLKQKTDSSVDDSYKSSLSYSAITALGGPIIAAENLRIDQWTQQVATNLVAMDRIGDPLYFLITPERFPEITPYLVNEVATHVREAIKVYYEMNLIPGCTRQGSPEFSPFANFDDGSCSIKPANTTFGGVYQTCRVSGRYLYTNPCSGKSPENPKTGQHSCPASYTAVRIYQGTVRGKLESSQRCRSCGFLWLRRCCSTTNYQAYANLETYWCAASGLVTPESGYKFGGIYTSTSVNLVTGSKGCPTNFQTMKLLADLTICLSDEFGLGTEFSIPFAGFFSCQEGNPLASPNFRDSGSTQTSSWPKKCPEGFSQHLATVSMGCAIHYCAESKALGGPNLPPVKRPPFMLKPEVPMMSVESYVMYNVETKTWTEGQKAEEMYEAAPLAGASTSGEGNGVSATHATALTVVTLVCILSSLLSTLASDVTA